MTNNDRPAPRRLHLPGEPEPNTEAWARLHGRRSTPCPDCGLPGSPNFDGYCLPCHNDRTGVPLPGAEVPR